MFDNPEKLFIILVIALLIFGPQKLAGLGSTIGKTIREFRGAVRGAQESFTSAMDDAAAPEQSQPDALPAPNPMPDPMVYVERTAVTVEPSQPVGAELDGASSLASEPTAEALRKGLNPKR
jgi:TatA/E family protein of Tat protein translocase